MDISPDGNYIFTCTLLNVDSLSSVADGRIDNEQSTTLRGDNHSNNNNNNNNHHHNSTRDKPSGPFSAFDHFTSALMKIVSLDNDSEEKSPEKNNYTQINNQKDINRTEKLVDKYALISSLSVSIYKSFKFLL